MGIQYHLRQPWTFKTSVKGLQMWQSDMQEIWSLLEQKHKAEDGGTQSTVVFLHKRILHWMPTSLHYEESPGITAPVRTSTFTQVNLTCDFYSFLHGQLCLPSHGTLLISHIPFSYNYGIIELFGGKQRKMKALFLCCAWLWLDSCLKLPPAVWAVFLLLIILLFCLLLVVIDLEQPRWKVEALLTTEAVSVSFQQACYILSNSVWNGFTHFPSFVSSKVL